MGKSATAAAAIKPISHNFFNQFLVIPTMNILAVFYFIFNSLHLPGAFGLAIIALVVLVRLVLHPIFVRQIAMQKKMQVLKPHLERIQTQHKKDPKRLQEEQMKLYKEHGFNPATGCLPMLIQFPIFIGLYSTLNLLLQHGASAKAIAEINKVLYVPALKFNQIDPYFLGFNLAVSPQHSGQMYYMIVPVITGALQYLQGRYTMPGAMPVEEPAHAKKGDKKLAKANQEEPKKESGGEFQKAMNMQMKYFLPLLLAYFSYTLPVGLSLYWNIFSIFSILQYRRVYKNSA